MRRPSAAAQPPVHTLLEISDGSEVEDDLELSIRSAPSSRHGGYPQERLVEPPVDYFVALNGSETKQKRSTTTLSCSFASIFATLLLGVVLCYGSFYVGVQWEGASKIHKTVLDEALAEAREEMLQDQEHLVLELAKVRRELNQRKEAEPISSKSRESRSKKDEELDDLYHHVELLKKNLKIKTDKLNEETKARQEAEANINQAWGAYELHTSQRQAERNKRNEDLASLFENLTSEEFGMGPYYVQFQLHLPEDDDDKDGTFSSLPHPDSFFTVELFSSTPTSAFFFLKQVQAGIWDGRFFHYNDPHFMLTDLTMASDSISSVGSSFAREIMSSQRDSLDEMRSTGLAHLPFSDYTDSAPHSAYTLGYRGVDTWKDRPGPAFFINRVDNKKDHKGQPCFGRVLLGRHVVDRMGEFQGPPNSPSFIKPIEIVSAQILDELTDAVGGEEYVRELEKKSAKEEM